jgi:hypothetical protein
VLSNLIFSIIEVAANIIPMPVDNPSIPSSQLKALMMISIQKIVNKSSGKCIE